LFLNRLDQALMVFEPASFQIAVGEFLIKSVRAEYFPLDHSIRRAWQGTQGDHPINLGQKWTVKSYKFETQL